MTRLNLLALATLVLLGATMYELFQIGGRVSIAIVAALAGGAVGYLMFMRESPVRWNEREKMVEAEQMTILGFTVVALFIVIKIVAAVWLTKILPEEAQAYLVAAFFGFLAGRLLGMFAEIRRTYPYRYR